MGKVNQAGGALSDEMVITPGGPRFKSNVHLIESGYHVATIDGALHKVHTESGQAIKFLGKMNAVSKDRMALRNLDITEQTGPKSGGWIVSAAWLNNSGAPISFFSTDWMVPPPPATENGQLIYLFNGIESADFKVILQPVLQWGVSQAGGGNYWSIANWYVGAPGSGLALHSPLIPVNPGEYLRGIMALTGQTDGTFDYNSAFYGYDNELSVKNIGELKCTSETLECYGLKEFSDYPAAPGIKFINIEVQTGGSPAKLAWSPYEPVQDNGQRCDIVNNNSQDGEIDLYY